MLEWEQIQAMAAFVPVFGAAGYTSLHPLYLIGVDWTQSPFQEALISCGNPGWRDNGESARQLWYCLQRFMEEGPQGLPVPQALPPRMSRWQTFLYGYRQWVTNFRKDLSEPGGKLKAIILVPVRVIRLITVIFTDSIAEVLEYNVPYTQFPKEIDELCDFHEDAIADQLPQLSLKSSLINMNDWYRAGHNDAGQHTVNWLSSYPILGSAAFQILKNR